MSVMLRSQFAAQDIEQVNSVHYKDREIVVCFGDGACPRISIDLLREYGVSDDEWSAVIADEHYIHVPTTHGDVDIPWDVLRYLSDASFRKEWDEAMRTASQIAGERLRKLREQRGLTLRNSQDSSVKMQTRSSPQKPGNPTPSNWNRAS